MTLKELYAKADCVACKNTNRRYIGIELDENYFKVACNRLRGEE